MPELAAIQISPESLASVRASLFGVEKAVDAVIIRVVNRTGQWAKTRSIEAVRQTLGMQRRDVDADKNVGRLGGFGHSYGGVSLRKTNTVLTAARVRISGQRIPVYRLSGRPVLPQKNRGGASWLRMGSRVRVRRGFTAEMLSGHLGIFRRVGAKRIMKRGRYVGRMRQPIAEFFGPSIPHVAEESADFNRLLQLDTGQYMELRLQKEMQFLLTGAAPPSDDEMESD